MRPEPEHFDEFIKWLKEDSVYLNRLRKALEKELDLLIAFAS